MLTAILISVFFIFFPLFISVKIKDNFDKNGLILRVKLFDFIKIFQKKIDIINFNNKFYKNNKIKKIKEFNLIKINGNFIINLNDIENSFYIICIFNLINNLIGNIIKNKKQYLKYNNNLSINIMDNKNYFNINLTFLTNILSILINLIRNIFYDKK